MAALLLKNIRAAVTCRDDDRVLENVDILCDEGFIRSIGSGLPAGTRRCWTAPVFSATPAL